MNNDRGRKLRTALSYGLTLFCNVSDNGGISFRVKKSYKDKETGEYKDTEYLYDTDLAALAQLIPQAIAWADLERIKISQAKKGGVAQEAVSSPVVASTKSFEDDDIPY